MHGKEWCAAKDKEIAQAKASAAADKAAFEAASKKDQKHYLADAKKRAAPPKGQSSKLDGLSGPERHATRVVHGR